MRLLFYRKVEDEIDARFLQAAEEVVAKEEIEVFRTVEGLRARLCRPRNGLSIALFLPTTEEDLASISSVRELFWNIRIILILPDRELDTIVKGHRLRPRFLSYVDSDSKDVRAVLNRMLENERQ